MKEGFYHLSSSADGCCNNNTHCNTKRVQTLCSYKYAPVVAGKNECELGTVISVNRGPGCPQCPLYPLTFNCLESGRSPVVARLMSAYMCAPVPVGDLLWYPFGTFAGSEFCAFRMSVIMCVLYAVWSPEVQAG